MPLEIEIALVMFAALVIGVMIYAVVRLLRDPAPANANPRAQRLARLAGFPRLFDGLLARPMTRREKQGWLLFVLILVLAVAFSGAR